MARYPCRYLGSDRLEHFTPETMITNKETRTWAMAIHLSQFAGYLVPLAAFVVPIVIWQVQKDDMPELDIHGRIVTNWLLSSLIYFTVFGVLSFVIIGIPFVFVLLALTIVFPIVGGIKANQGRAWKYPLSINFF